MPRIRKPRAGSMQFWHRCRANRPYAKVGYWTKDFKDAKPLGFAGYKVGMTHITIIDNKKTSKTKGEELKIPVTIVECPPLKIASVRFYKTVDHNPKVVTEIFSKNVEKVLGKKIRIPKKEPKKIDDIKPEEFDDIRIIAYTQPKLTKIGKKKPELFELGLGGSKEEKITYVKENLSKEILIKDIFNEGQEIDAHFVTKGKGFQGPIKRFGVHRVSHKSEKGVRRVGTLSGWEGHGHFLYRIAHAGQMGYHMRTQFNNIILKIGDKKEEIVPKGGFVNYGETNNTYLLVKGSLGGHKKRLITLTQPIRPSKKLGEAPEIKSISLISQQRR